MATPRAYGKEVWSSPRWRAEAAAWLDARLAAAGRRRTGDVEHLHVRPWATAMRAPTTDGFVWMKAAGPATAFEVGLYELLHQVAPDHVLRPIATDTERAWMVLEDGGPVLTDLMEGDELVAAMAAALGRYAELQRLVAPHADELMSLGAIDMRPAVLPERFEQALELVADRDDRARLEALRPDVAQWCAELDERTRGSQHRPQRPAPRQRVRGPAPARLRLGRQRGGAPLRHDADRPGLHARAVLDAPEDDPRVLRLRDAYLDGFTDLAPRAELVRALELARRLALIAHALTWDRVLRAMPAADVPEGWEAMPASFLTSLATPA